MSEIRAEEAHEKARGTWDANASFWNEQMGDGNDFVNYLIWPATERLLGLKPGEEVLDIACGNGVFSRKLAQMGGKVTAFDFSNGMIEAAKSLESEATPAVDYHHLDGTDSEALLGLGSRRFDVALCGMALFDMADIGPLFDALPKLLKPGGRFVFSLIHPCFNNDHIVQVGEMEDREGVILTRYGVKVFGYMTPTISEGLAMVGQPVPHPYFHRPLHVIMQRLFESGFVLDGFEERAFPPDYEGGTLPLSWSGKYSEIPPVLVARARVG